MVSRPFSAFKLLFGVVELQGTLLNLAGAALAGLASVLVEHGGVQACLAKAPNPTDCI